MATMDLQIEGNAALVTGSTSGLGKASARALLREGANVMINGRDETRLAAAIDELSSVGSGSVRGVAGDLTEPETIEALVESTLDEFGRLDHLVTSVGGPASNRFLDIPESDWYAAYDALVMSVVRLVGRAAEPLAADDGGTIVTITSRVVKEAVETNPLSSAVRMGVIGIEKTLSRELAPDVRVNAVLPGAHETPRIRELAEQSVDRGEHASVDEALDRRARDIPLGRLGHPMELGDTVAFLSSPRSGYITGTTVIVDGGRTRATL